MANKLDDEFAAVAAVDATCGVPYYVTVGAVAASITNLPAGRYWVRLDGVGAVFVLVGGTAAVPASGAAAAANTRSLSHGETYVHASTATLSVIAHGSGHLHMQPVAQSS